MSIGQIVEWHFQTIVFNQGTIAGCSPDVHGQFFTFTLSNVVDPVLRDMLAHAANFSKPPNCSEGQNPRWVSFQPNGHIAMNIVRLFH
jgi:hypothetical protein